MKLRNVMQLLGVRGKARHYPYHVQECSVGEGMVTRYAQWQHPSGMAVELTAELVAGYRQCIAEGDFCIDIGAFTGDTALPMGIAAGKSGCVLALEPNPHVYHVLEKNARANRGLANILTMQAAASQEEGFMEFDYSDPGFCNGGRHEGLSVLSHGHAFKLAVFAVNLENELRSDFGDLLPKLSFLKVDAEGYDLHVLQSLSGIIQEFRPTLKAEIFKKTSAEYRRNMLGFLAGVGYTAFRIVQDPVVPGAKLAEDSVASGEHYDILCVPNEELDQDGAFMPRNG